MKRKIRMALVEDNRFHAILFERAVRERYPDCEVTTYRTGKAFLQDMASARFDLGAVDFHLPDIDGLELLALIRAGKPDLPIVVITGGGSEQIAAEAIKMGAMDYVTKSGDFESALPRIIQQAFQKQQLILKSRRLEAKAREGEKLEMVTTVASTLNHEINNQVMAILGKLELLLEDPQIVDPDAVEKLHMIETSARRIQEITHQMAGLMTTSVKHTPVGPMLRLVGRRIPRQRDASPEVIPADKTD